MVRRYKVHERGIVRDMFLHLMPDLSPVDLHDGVMTAINGYLTIDLEKLDRALEKLYPNEAEDFSMKEIVQKHYGKKAVELIKNMI